MKIEDLEKAQEFLYKINALKGLEKEISYAIGNCGDGFLDNERVSFKSKVLTLLQELRDSAARKIEKL